MLTFLRHKLSVFFPAIFAFLFLAQTASSQTDDGCDPQRAVRLTIQTSPNPSLPGQSVSIGAFLESVMNAADPSGEVQFLDGSTDLGTFPVKQSQVHTSRVFNDAGAHVITANYSGDINFCSKSVSFGQPVDRITSTISLTSSAPTAAVGAPVILTAQLGTATPAGVTGPSGPIQFVEGSTVLGSAAPVSGKATLTVANLSAGTHQITAVLTGDANWFSVRSAALTETVNRAASTVTLSAIYTLSSNGIVPTFTAAVAAGAGGVVPGGTVQFVDATTSVVLGTATLPVGSAAVTVTVATPQIVPSVGHPITALYSGDANFSPSTSAPLTLPGIANAAGGIFHPTFVPDELVSLFSAGLASITLQAPTVPLPTSLAGDTVTVTDSLGVARPAGLYLVFPGQINFVIPAGTAPGTALIAVASGSTSLVQIRATITNSAVPGLFSAGGNGKGLAAAQIVRDQVVQGVDTPIRLLNDDVPVYLVLYGTGVRSRTSLAAVSCIVGGRALRVDYAGPQPSFPGLDQINVLLSPALIGAGQVNVIITVDGQESNTVTLTFQ